MNQASPELCRDPLSDGVESDTPGEIRHWRVPSHVFATHGPFPSSRSSNDYGLPGRNRSCTRTNEWAQADLARVALRIGVTASWCRRNIAAGGLSAHVADVVAIGIGCHPSEIWPDWFSHAPNDAEVETFERQQVLRRRWASYRAGRVHVPLRIR